MKKIISLFTTLCIVFSMLGTFTVFAEETAADLEISTLAELEAFRDDVNNGNTYEGKTVKLTADIDMSSYYGKYAMSWTPIGITDRENDIYTLFAGTFDGANHAIIGLYINTDEDFAALFNSVKGTLKNLNVKGSVLATSFGAEAAGIAVSNNGSIINCTFDGTVECPHYFAAGISADNGGVIENCKVSGKIIGEHNVGGISGYSGGEFINCINEAEIIGWAPVGGIASSGAGSKITNCINKGSVTGRSYVDTYTNGNGEEITTVIESFSIGGIVGETSTMDTIENCYNTGAVSGNSEVGGIIGVAGGSPEEPLQVKNCYNIGNITSTMENNDGEHNIGAIIGNSENDYAKAITSEAVNCYYLVGTADKGCGGNAEDTATAFTTEQFADKTNFNNWDFDTIWEMDVTSGRPVLRSNAEDTDEVIEISTLAELEAFRDDVNNGNTYEGKTVNLTADIDMSEKYGEGKESWTPIGIDDWQNNIHKSFSGTFDGGNHTISRLYINTDEDFAALFNSVKGTLKNLNVKGSVLATSFGAEAAGIAVSNNGSIINCTFDGIVECPNYSAAGIATENQGIIENCKVSGKIIGEHNVGGISGCSEGEFTNCINEAEIIGWCPVGGIASINSGTITNCINKGNITARPYIDTYTDDESGEEITNIIESISIGGIVGEVYRCTIENCYNIGAISGNSDVGGIIGGAGCPPEEPFQVKNCYNIGNITSTMENDGEHNIGAVIGSRARDFEAVNCYYLTGTADKGIAAIGGDGEDTTTVLTTEQFANKTTFANWDFETVWEMDATLGRPVLRSNTEEPPIETHTHKICGDENCTDNHDNIEWTAWNSTDALPTEAGNYYLTKDITLTEHWLPYVYVEINLCLNGHIITVDNYSLRNSGTKIFTDCSNTIHKFSVADDGSWVLDEQHGTETVTGGVITGHNEYSDGAAIIIPENSIFSMYNINVIGNKAYTGLTGLDVSGLNGAVYVGAGTFNMYSGKIMGNTAHYCGGGVDVYSGTFNMYGGEISRNRANCGGGVCNNSTFNMYGGKISENISEENGGVNNISTMTVGGTSVIKDNNGGNVCLYEYDSEYDYFDVNNPLSDGAYIGITFVDIAPTEGNPVDITGANDTDYSKYFHSDDENYKIVNGENNVIQLAVKHTHDWGAWSITTEPTLTTTGKAERICGNDNTHKDNVDLPILTDTSVWTAGARVEPTETADGSQVYTSDYGNVTITIPALGHTHDWGAWSIITAPKFTETGIAERICTENENHKDTVILPILGNNEVWKKDLKIEPTETENGLIIYTSQYGTVTVIVPALNPNYDYGIKYENEKAVVTVPQDGTYTVIFAAYDNGRLLSVNAQDIQLVKGENSPISPQNFNSNGKVKVMLWDSLKGMKPLCTADGN